MSDQAWLQVAKALPAGRSMRIPCCKQDNSMLVSHGDRGYHAHCFRCGFDEHERHGERSISDILRHKAELSYMQNASVELPSDYTPDIPLEAALWYMKVGISPELAREYRIGYTERLNRVVLPVYEGVDDLVALQMRACEVEQKPKYLNPTGPRVNGAVFFRNGERDGAGVVTEDILSAIKVGKVVDSASILGTNMTDERAVKIARVWRREVVLWLDPDKAGLKGRAEAVRQLQMQGCSVSKITSDKDPKYYSLDQIKELIKGRTRID